MSVEMASVETNRSVISPNTLKSVSAFVAPEYTHRTPEEVDTAILQVSQVIDSWANDHINEMIPALKDLRLRLAKLYGGDTLVRKFEHPNVSEDVLGSVDASVSVPVQMMDKKSTTNSVTAKLPIVDETDRGLPYSPLTSNGNGTNDVQQIHALSVSDHKTDVQTNSVQESVKDSLDFSVLVGNGLTDLQAEADKIRKQNQISDYVKDIMILLCKLSLF